LQQKTGIKTKAKTDGMRPGTLPPSLIERLQMGISTAKPVPARPRAFILCLFLALWGFALIYLPLSPYRVLFNRLSGRVWRENFDLDFRSFLIPGYMIREGNLRIYDLEEYDKYSFYVEIESCEPGGITAPPTFFVMLLPLTHLPLYWAADIWLLLKVLAIMWSGFLLASLFWPKEAPPGTKAAAIVFSILTILAFSPTLDDLVAGQTNPIVFFLLCMSLFLLKRGSPVAGGIVLGLVFCVKLVSGVIILYLLLTRRWNVALPALAVIGLMYLITLAVAGPQVFYSYFQNVPNDVYIYKYFQHSSIPSRLEFLIPGRDGIIRALHAAISLGFLGLALFRLGRQGGGISLEYEFSLLLTTTMIISPIVNPAHHIWLLLPLFLTGRRLWDEDLGNPGNFLTALTAVACYFLLAVLDGWTASPLKEEILLRNGFQFYGVAFAIPIVIWLILLFKINSGSRQALPGGVQ
jgi:hypothetical protein